MYDSGRIAYCDMQIFVLVLGNQHWKADKGDFYRVLALGIVIDVIDFFGTLCSVRQNKRICAQTPTQQVVSAHSFNVVRACDPNEPIVGFIALRHEIQAVLPIGDVVHVGRCAIMCLQGKFVHYFDVGTGDWAVIGHDCIICIIIGIMNIWVPHSGRMPDFV